MRQWIWIVVLAAWLMLGLVLPVEAMKPPAYQPEDLKMIKVMLPDGAKCGYVFVGNGKWVISPQFEEAAFSFNQNTGLAAVKIGGKYGFIDVRGQVVIPPQFDKVGWSWAEDRMDVKVDNQTGFIDRTGKMVIGLQPGQVSSFSEGLASVQVEDTTRFINKTGAAVFEVSGWCGSFREGLASVLPRPRGSLATGFVDKTGKMVIQPQAGLFLSSFTEGRAPIRVGGKYGFIDKSGEIVIPAQFDGAFMFREGLAPVLVGRKIGFIDLQGRMVLQAQYDYPDNNWQPQIALGNSLFRQGHAKVKWNGKFGIIDKDGKWVVQPIFDSMIAFYSKHKMVFAGGYYYDLTGKKLDHYVNHMQDGDKALKDGNQIGALAFFRAALEINPGDVAATLTLSQAEGQIK